MQCSCSDKNSDTKIDFDLLSPVLAEYRDVKGGLITILQKAQEIYGYLPVELLLHISQETKIKPAKIMGVVSFYTQFRRNPVGKHIITLCQGTACHVLGSANIERAIGEYLGIADGETTEDGLFTFMNAACLGCCSLAPVMMIDNETYGNLTPDSTKEILSQIRQGAMV